MQPQAKYADHRHEGPENDLLDGEIIRVPQRHQLVCYQPNTAQQH
jgi:hypothetical protein